MTPPVDEKSAEAQAQRAARSGDERALGFLLDRHRLGMELFCRLMLSEPPLAHEALEEIALTAWRERGRMPATGSPRVWLYRIAVRVCSQVLRESTMSSDCGER